MKSFLGISFFLALAQAGVQGPVIEVRPSTANVSIGERFQVTVEARGPSGTAWEFPKQINDGSVELIQSNPSTALANSVTYDAQVFAIGAEGRIPEIEVRYKTQDGSPGLVKSAPVALNVVSTLDPNDKNPAPADFAPPLPVFVSRAFWVASGLAGLAFGNPQRGDPLADRRGLREPRRPHSARPGFLGSQRLAGPPAGGQGENPRRGDDVRHEGLLAPLAEAAARRRPLSLPLHERRPGPPRHARGVARLGRRRVRRLDPRQGGV